MINRTIIRQKVVQLMYAYYQNGSRNLDVAEKELLTSLSKSYELYHNLLLLMVKLTRVAAEDVEQQEELNRLTHRDLPVSYRFANNAFAVQLSDNKQLNEYFEHRQCVWDAEPSYVKTLYEDIKKSDIYKDYMDTPSTDYESDREVWRKIYKNVIMPDEGMDSLLEEQSLYWNDDREIIDTFVLKTIKKFAKETGPNQELLPGFKDDDDREFAVRLFRHAIMNDEYYRSLITRNIQNWEFDRMAFMDVIIMQVAIAEILSFPQIPLSVSINEYVEIAKVYSTPKSFGYVNGILDGVTRTLIEDGKLLKR